ncbi:hypothetical protein pdam_00000056 [Pocillopora damicornis]|uniref:Transcription initiation factor IIA subunit 1 n=1 Tax=Pocillopora damicornis TaxID=46731 RepID=A0A3M6UWZ9_POCDA|nr:hypothetical protein pdam_00000056 [Pocillopora damicornis]
MATSNVVPKIYSGVIEEVIKNVRDSFLNEGVDEQVLQELKQIWESKLLQSRAVDWMPAEGHQVTRPHQYTYPHGPPINRQVQEPREVNIAPAAVTVPEAATPQQAASGHTAILYPSTHAHALSQMTAAASAATMAIPENLSQIQQGSTYVYPTVRTIHSTPQVGNLQQQVINATQPRTITGTQQVIHAQPQTAIVHGAQTSAARVPQQVIQMAQLPTGNKHDEDPLNSDDDVSDDDPTDLFDTDNVVVCQFDKASACSLTIARSRNKWKFHLKDGIMNLKGKDYVFQKANGEAEW